ncbi:hypothetical protein VTJ83DRAFT_7083 [Remersonia thermophila]|uniref:Uncharacterized protein n=1 Tax=Remersonia thermophila TaxID=72144 RepID=A0ABR4D2M6_9PEZI
MRRETTLRRIAAAAAAAGVSLLSSSALALPQAGITAEPAPIVWVTVDASGSASTITPGVITTEGHRATVSQAPDALISTATYTLSPPGGRYTTYTGLAPAASATGANGSPEGIFPACDSNANVGPVEPFCLPRAGSELVQGKTYYITWSGSYFQPPTRELTLQVYYTDLTRDPNDGPLGHLGHTSEPFPASQGFYAWSIPSNFLSQQQRGNPNRMNVTFVLAYDDDATPADADLVQRVGPSVFVVAKTRKHVVSNNPGASEDDDDDDDDDNDSGSGGSGLNVLAIALPLSIVAVLLVAFGLCYTRYRRTGAVPLFGAAVTKLRRRSTGGGYGVRQSRAERTGSVAAGAGIGVGARGAAPDNKSETDVDGGIQLTDRESWSPRSGRNVFREEVERQAKVKGQEGR